MRACEGECNLMQVNRESLPKEAAFKLKNKQMLARKGNSGSEESQTVEIARSSEV